MTVIAMSRPEIDRMHVLRDLAAGRMTVNEAAQLTRLTRRHVFRLAKAYRERGPSALVSTRRGQPSNHRYPWSRTLLVHPSAWWPSTINAAQRSSGSER